MLYWYRRKLDKILLFRWAVWKGCPPSLCKRMIDMNTFDSRTLCHRCKDDYISAGYQVNRDYACRTMEPCDKCGRMGWVYTLTKLCARCGAVIPLGSALCKRCEAERPNRQAIYDRRVRNKRSAAFYQSADWIKLRDISMSKASYMCQECKRKGIVRPAEEVHHIVPIQTDWSRRLDPTNLICLCHKCHMQAHGGSKKV